MAMKMPLEGSISYSPLLFIFEEDLSAAKMLLPSEVARARVGWGWNYFSAQFQAFLPPPRLSTSHAVEQNYFIQDTPVEML